MDAIPKRLLETYRSLKDHKNSGVTFVDCFPGLKDIDTDEALCAKLKYLARAYQLKLRALNDEKKREKKWNPDYDLSRVLGPRFNDPDEYMQLCEQCKSFFDKTDVSQREQIRQALNGSFEQAEEDDRAKELRNGLESAEGFSIPRVSLDKMREQFIDFRHQGFALPYIMLRMTDKRKEKQNKKKLEENPCWKDLADCSRETLIPETKKKALALCRDYFPDLGKEDTEKVLAAHLANNGSETFFWTMLGETALSYLNTDGKEETQA